MPLSKFMRQHAPSQTVTKDTKNMSLWVTDSSSDDDDETEEVVQVVPPPKKKTQPPKKAQKKQVAPSTSHESPSKKCKT